MRHSIAAALSRSARWPAARCADDAASAGNQTLHVALSREFVGRRFLEIQRQIIAKAIFDGQTELDVPRNDHLETNRP
jgi:hypothetical protein